MMNKFFGILCFVFMLGINGCQSNQKLQNVSIESELTEISLSIHDIWNGGLSFDFENISTKKYIYGSDYKLYALKNNVWEVVEPIIENAAFTSEGYYILPQSKTETIMVDWIWLFGKLPPGEYKFEKRILFLRSPGDYDDFLLTQSFTLK